MFFSSRFDSMSLAHANQVLLSNQKPASDLPVPPTIYWHPPATALLHGYICYLRWEEFSCIFHALICSHSFWKAVLVFRGRRIFLHSCLTIELCLSRFLPLLSKQVRPGMLSVKFLCVGFVLASVFSLLWLLCFKLQCLCVSPQYFSTLENSLVSLFVLLTTAK